MVLGVGFGAEDGDMMLYSYNDPQVRCFGRCPVGTLMLIRCSICTLSWAMLRGYVGVDVEEARRIGNLCL